MAGIRLREAVARFMATAAGGGYKNRFPHGRGEVQTQSGRFLPKAPCDDLVVMICAMVLAYADAFVVSGNFRFYYGTLAVGRLVAGPCTKPARRDWRRKLLRSCRGPKSWKLRALQRMTASADPSSRGGFFMA